MYVFRSKSGRSITIALFVDDVLPMYHPADLNEPNVLKSALMNKYSMKDLGEASWLSDMKITRGRSR